MCRKSILFVLVFLVFTYVLSKEVKSQAPVKPQAIAPPAVVEKQDDMVQVPAKAVSLSPPLLIGQDTDRKSGNIWSIQIEQVDGKNIIRATIGKKSAVRIVCDQVDLQTPRDIFQAQGNVELSGEGVQGRCEKLTINLNEDRLNLDGKAEVGIYKQQAPAKDAPGASQKFLVELKGEQLSVRWPDLEAKVEDPPQPPRVCENANPAPEPAITDVPQSQPVPYVPPSQD